MMRKFHTRSVRICGGAALMFAATTGGHAQDKYQVTDAERAACKDDAAKLCSAAYPDEDALLTCFKANIENLTPTCRSTFVAGLRRRGLK